MRDYISIGSSPSSEECAQVGSDDYDSISRIECRAFVHQLERLFPNLPTGAYLSTKSFPHDFGTYKEVVCYFDDDDEESQKYAYNIESNTPEYWDEEAKQELKSNVENKL
jgi:hypothetical protein